MKHRSSHPPPSIAPASRGPATRRRRHQPLANEPGPGASPGTLVIDSTATPKMVVIDFCPTHMTEREIASIDEVVPYLTDDIPSITWLDVRGLGDPPTFQRLGEIFKLHPLALEDIVNVPQRPKSDTYSEHQVVIARMVQVGDDGRVRTEQIGILFREGIVLTVQEEAATDVLDSVRTRIRSSRGPLRSAGADFLAYALLDAIVDGFFPVLEAIGERLEELEIEVTENGHHSSRAIHDIKRELLTVRRAIWPQRDLLNNMLRDESAHVSKETRIYLRDTYDHAVQVMDMVETFREIAGGLMDLYLSAVSNRMNEIMKVLTIISTIFLPLTFIAGVYGMNFDGMPELHWSFGYPFALMLMVSSVVILMVYYRRKGWIGGHDGAAKAPRE